MVPILAYLRFARAVRQADESIGRIWDACLRMLNCDLDHDADSAPVLIAVTGDHGCRMIQYAIVPSAIRWPWKELSLWQYYPDRRSSVKLGIIDNIVESIGSHVDYIEFDGGAMRIWLRNPDHAVNVDKWIKSAIFSNGHHLKDYLSTYTYSSESTEHIDCFTESVHPHLGDLVYIAAENCALLKYKWVKSGSMAKGEGRIPLGEHGTNYQQDRLVPLLISNSLVSNLTYNQTDFHNIFVTQLAPQ